MDHFNNQYDPFLDLSTSSSPASQIEVEEVDSTPHKKRKELNRKSEKNRRNRFNEKLQLLQELLFASEGHRSKKKIRKEDVVEEAISYIQELRKKSQDNVLNLMANAPAKILMDPLSTSVSVADLESAFVPIFQQSYLTLTTSKPPFSTFKLSHYIKSQYKLLYDIAVKTDRMDFMLYSEMFAETGYFGLAFSPKDFLPHAERAYALFESVKKSGMLSLVGSRFELQGHDLACMLYCDMATIYYMKGKFSEHSKIYNELKDSPELQMSSGHMYNLLYADFTRDLINERAPSLPTAMRMAEKLEKMGHQGKFFVGFSLISHSTNKEDIDYGLDLIHHTLETSTCTDNSSIVAASVLPVKAFLKARRYDEGLSRVIQSIKEIEQWELEGHFGLSDLFRLKAELLYEKAILDGNFGESYVEVELLLHKALEHSRALHCPLLELRVLVALLRMLQVQPMLLTLKEEIESQALSILKEIEMIGSLRSTIVEAAQVLLDL